MQPHNHLKAYVEDFIQAAREGREMDMEVASSQLEQFDDQLQAILNNYAGKAVQGTEDFQEAMIEAIEYLQQALGFLDLYIETPSEEHLKNAYLQSKAGDELMTAIFEEAREHQKHQGSTSYG